MSWLNADPRFVAGGDGHGLGRLLRPRPVRSLRGRGPLVKRRAIPRGHSGSGPTRPRREHLHMRREAVVSYALRIRRFSPI